MCLSFICNFWLLDIILNSTELRCTQNIKLYHFVHTILSMPFCPIPFCPYTILSIPFCPVTRLKQYSSNTKNLSFHARVYISGHTFFIDREGLGQSLGRPTIFFRFDCYKILDLREPKMYSIWHEMFKIALVSGAPSQTPLGDLKTLPRPASREGLLAVGNRSFDRAFGACNIPTRKDSLVGL